MTTNDETFRFPFISNLIHGKVESRSQSLHRRSVSMKDKALCLDDDPLSLRLVEHLLKKRYEVIACANMESAIRAVRKHRMDLFLCDYHLGESFTGAQAYDELRNEYGFNPAHRILITSYPSPEIEAETMAAGFDRVFSKPLRKEFQLHCLNLHLPEVDLKPSVSFG